MLPPGLVLTFAPIRVPKFRTYLVVLWPCDGSFYDRFRFRSPPFDCLVYYLSVHARCS